MSLTTLKEDLLAEFRDERLMINDQIDILDPLAIALRKPAAHRLLSSSTLILTEYSCYAISLGGLAFTILLPKIYPFSMLGDLIYNADFRNTVGATNLAYFVLAFYGFVILGVVLFLIVGRMAREIRLKNDILNQAGKDIKTIVGMHLERKAAIDTIEQRHMLGMSGIAVPPQPTKSVVNEVDIPGYMR